LSSHCMESEDIMYVAVHQHVLDRSGLDPPGHNIHG
jgi:hypothetical protein